MALALVVTVAGCDPNPEGPAAPPMPPGGFPKSAAAAPGLRPPLNAAKPKPGTKNSAGASGVD